MKTMNSAKGILDMQAKHINELLQELGVDIDLSIEYAHGQPRLFADNGSRIMSMRESKPNLDATFYAIKNILYEIGRVQRHQGLHGLRAVPVEKRG